MSVQIDRLPSSMRDLDEITEYLRQNSGPERAIRFLRHAEATFRRLASMPGLGTRCETELPIPVEVRYSAVDRFRSYLVFYRPTAEGIQVIRVLHSARDLDRLLGDQFGVEGDDDPDAR